MFKVSDILSHLVSWVNFIVARTTSKLGLQGFLSTSVRPSEVNSSNLLLVLCEIPPRTLERPTVILHKRVVQRSQLGQRASFVILLRSQSHQAVNTRLGSASYSAFPLSEVDRRLFILLTQFPSFALDIFES